MIIYFTIPIGLLLLYMIEGEEYRQNVIMYTFVISLAIYCTINLCAYWLIIRHAKIQREDIIDTTALAVAINEY